MIKCKEVVDWLPRMLIQKRIKEVFHFQQEQNKKLFKAIKTKTNKKQKQKNRSCPCIENKQVTSLQTASLGGTGKHLGLPQSFGQLHITPLTQQARHNN